MKSDDSLTRREFVASTSKAVAGAVLLSQVPVSSFAAGKKKRLAMVGTGHRGTGMWGKSVLQSYGNQVEFVGLCDSNPGRLETAKRMMGVSCPSFANYEEMIDRTQPDMVIVT